MPKPTKIEKVETFLWDRWLLIKIHCEDGTVGIGEGGVHGWQRPTKTMIETMEPYLLGKDPHQIEHHYQYLYRSSHFMGSVVQGALSAIDIALWDIKGKRLGCRSTTSWAARPATACAATCTPARRQTTTPRRDWPRTLSSSPKRGSQPSDSRRSPVTSICTSRTAGGPMRRSTRVGAVREAVGPDVDICVEIHRQMNPAESIWLGRRLEQFNPFFYEDPMLPDSPAIMGDVAELCNIPIATGERFTTIFEYQQLLEAKAASYVRPDLCLCGGLSGCKKVAAMAEAHHVKVIPHNPLSPVSTAACVQLDACIPNFALQEYTGESEPPKSDLLLNPLELIEGYLTVPEGPGLGIELNEAALSQPENPKVLNTPIGFDGSVQDR